MRTLGPRNVIDVELLGSNCARVGARLETVVVEPVTGLLCITVRANVDDAREDVRQAGGVLGAVEPGRRESGYEPDVREEGFRLVGSRDEALSGGLHEDL